MNENGQIARYGATLFQTRRHGRLQPNRARREAWYFPNEAFFTRFFLPYCRNRLQACYLGLLMARNSERGNTLVSIS